MLTLTVAIALALSLPQAPGSRSDASRLTFSPPATVVVLDLGKLKGEPLRLAWSPDAQQFYLQTGQRDSRGLVTRPRHYLVGANGQPPKGIDQEPEWASTYWAWKSAQAPSDLPAHKISVEQRQDTARATAAPMGGALARGGAEGGEGGGQGVGAGEAAAAAYQSQTVTIVTLRLKDEVLGEWTNQAVVPGSTFGWSRTGGLIAFAGRSGSLIVMDSQGRKQSLAGTAKATLPAWADDGTRLAYLERTGKKNSVLKVIRIAVP